MAKKESSLVITDTGPIIFLLQINRLEILHSLFGEVSITTGVYKEITKPSQKKIIKQEINKGWIKKVNSPPLEIFHQLGGGESSSISLALKYQNSLLIIDEKKARTVAKANGIRVTGTIGVLLLAKKNGLINDTRALIEEANKHHLWVAPELINKLKDEKLK